MNIIQLLTAIRNKGYSVRACIVGLVASILIPTLLITGWLTWRSANSERALLERNSETKSREVLLNIEHEVVSSHAMLTALGSSQFLQTDNFEAFHGQCSEVAKLLGAQIVLTDVKTGEQILNSAVPFGQPLPRIPTPALDARTETIRTGKAKISNVFFAPVLKRYFVSVGLPVMRSGDVAYYLAVGIPVDTFADALKNAALPDQWTVTLIDRDNTIVARSEKHSEVAGTKLRVDLAARVSGLEGATTGSDRYGISYRWTWQRSALTGWFVAIGVPLNALEAPAKNALTNFATAGGALFVIAIALSFYLGGQLSQLIGEMGIDRKPTREEFSVLFESAPNGVLVIDGQGLMLLMNERLKRKFGYTRDELVGQSVEILVPERFRHGHLSLRRDFSASPESRPMGSGRELFGRRKDGSEFPIEISLNSIATSNGNFVMAAVVDISMRVLSERRLLIALTERDDIRQQFMQAQEDERLRLAHELHDQTGQSLTAALLELKTLEMHLKDDGLNRVRTLRKSMEEMGKTLHRIAWELRPASIDELGLTSALTNYLSEWSHQYSIEADFHCSDAQLDSIANEKRTVIYRVVQEALTNVAKHAQGATSVSIIIDRAGSTLRLTIDDDGPGFETADVGGTANVRSMSGLGLAGMRERLTLIGGELEIESSVGTGTTIFVRIPLNSLRLIA